MYTQAELVKAAADVQVAVERCYWIMMEANVHSFTEFNGLMAIWANILQRCADENISFHEANTHSGKPLPVETHDLDYLAEKLECIFGPILEANPEAKRVFAKRLLGVDLPVGAG